MAGYEVNIGLGLITEAQEMLNKGDGMKCTEEGRAV